MTTFDALTDAVGIPYSDQYNVSGIQREMSLQNTLQGTNSETTRPSKRKRSGFEVRDDPVSDFISKGLITLDYAVSCFKTCVIAILLRQASWKMLILDLT